MSDAKATEIFICSFCEQVIQITLGHVGRRISCPKCARSILLYPNRRQIIDRQLASIWCYRRPRLLRKDQDVGPITDEEFVRLTQSGEIDGETEVRSPEITKDEWVPAARVRLGSVQERIEQRTAEQQWRLQKEQRQREAAARNMQLLSRGVAAAVADGHVSLNERNQLLAFAQSANIPEAEIKALLDAEAHKLLQTVIDECLADGILEPHEKQRISELAAGLGIALDLTPEQLRRLELCELAWQLAAGMYRPADIPLGDIALTANELPVARSRLEWFEVVQQKKPVGIFLGDDHYLKSVATGDCVVTSKRAILVGQFTTKKMPLASVERVRRFRDGIFCNRSSGKSVFLKPTTSGIKWDRFSLLVEHAVSKQPVLGVEPSASFIPSENSSIESVAAGDIVTLTWADSNSEPRYTFRVVGDHVGDRAYWIERTREGDAIRLLREPSNMHDPNAVAVLDANGHQLGYLKREVAAWFGPMLDRGYRIHCHAHRKPPSGGLIVGVVEA